MFNSGDVILFGMLQNCVVLCFGDWVCILVKGLFVLENLVVVEDEFVCYQIFMWLLLVMGMLFVLGLNYVDYVSELVFMLLKELLVFIKVLNIFIEYY